ncbi:hypothetical protein [Metapseudomonas otitidis]|uniref:hypothetical protein n=1 Tax=Metapseudomonas otitidis TaxID=319939 RepID=UPI002811EE6A|nr:hypothetical protein [Pseudomonas otitidis]WMR34726.1 hypothetical protein QT513_08300 [Pseudomonas otitidis]
MIYTGVLAAVVSALAAECIDNTAKQAWQRLIDGAMKSGRRPSVSPTDRMEADCWVHARLHSQLPPRLWNVLVARFSTHRARRLNAIAALFPVVNSPASALFRQKAICSWAIPQLRGVKADAGRQGRLEVKRSTDVIVLPARFYDMTTWDNEGTPERTRRRWRANIAKDLEQMVDQALALAEEILQAEGVLLDEAA